MLKSSWFADFGTAVSKIGSADVEIEISGGKIRNDLSVNSNTTLKWTGPGRKLSISSGKTLTVNGLIRAGLWQIFDGDGTISISSGQTGYIEWFGAQRDDTTDDTSSFRKAIASGLRHIRLANGTYFINTPSGSNEVKYHGFALYAVDITEKDGLLIEGSGYSVLKATKNGFAILQVYNSMNITIRNLIVIGENGDGNVGPAEIEI